MINEFYLPPRSLSDMLSEISNKGKRIAVLMGIMRWCFNSKSITIEGAEWLTSRLGVRMYNAHNFIVMRHDKVPMDKVLVLEKDITIEPSKLNGDFYRQMLACTKEVGGKDLYGEYLGHNDFVRALKAMAKWLPTDQGMITTDKVFKWGSIALDDDGDALFRYYNATREEVVFDPYEAKRNGLLEIHMDASRECSACGLSIPCVQKRHNGQNLCNSCFDGLNPQDEDLPKCSHVECAFECSNYDERRSSIDEDYHIVKYNDIGIQDAPF